MKHLARYLVLSPRFILTVFIISISACATNLDEFRSVNLEKGTESEVVETLQQGDDPFIVGELAIVGLDGNIYLADPETETVMKLTDDASLEPVEGQKFISYGEPTWSPSGDKLAFIRSVQDNGSSVDVSIIVSGLDMEHQVLLAGDERPFYLFWSPSGDALSFLASSPAAPISLWIKDLTGQGARVDRGQPYYWDWTPDGSRVFVHVGGSSAFDSEGAYLAFLGPANIRKSLGLEPLSFQAPAISPDGKKILVTARPETNSDRLLMLDGEGNIMQDIAPVEGRASFDWSPDGAHFAISIGPDLGSVHAGVLAIYEINEDARAEVFEQVDKDVIAFWWSPDGRKVAYFVPVLSTPELTQPISSRRQADNELFLQLYVYDLEVQKSERLVAFRPTSELLRVLPFFDQYQRSATIWSPDSSRLSYAAIGDRGSGQIYIVDVDGSRPSIGIAPGEIAYWTVKAQQ